MCWVELTEVADADALPGALAAALGVDVRHGKPLAALVTALAPLTMLLALDNAEHLLAGVARLCQALHEGATHVPAHEIARLIQRFEQLLAASREACEAAGLLEPVTE
mgnify:CR=1 FL=1